MREVDVDIPGDGSEKERRGKGSKIGENRTNIRVPNKTLNRGEKKGAGNKRRNFERCNDHVFGFSNKAIGKTICHLFPPFSSLHCNYM